MNNEIADNTRRRAGSSGRIVIAAAVLVVAWGAFTSTWLVRQGGAIGAYPCSAGRGWLAVGSSSAPVIASFPKGSDWPVWSIGQSAVVKLAPGPWWRPSRTSASVTTGGTAGSTSITLDAIWIPLWLPAAALTVLTGWLLWRTRWRARAGHCTKCDYNLRGVADRLCPECGQAW